MQTKIINICLPPEIVKEIDRKAKEEYRSRSELLREAALLYIQTKDNWQILQKDLTKRARKMGIKKESQVEELIDSERI